MARRSKGDASDKDILDVTLAWFMHCNFNAVEIGLMSHYLGQAGSIIFQGNFFQESKYLVFSSFFQDGKFNISPIAQVYKSNMNISFHFHDCH